MSAKIKSITGEHVDIPSNFQDQPRGNEVALLCRNALVSIGLKYLLEGTCFPITHSASDEGSFSHRYSESLPDLSILDGSDAPGHIIDTAKTLKDRNPEARIVLVADGFDLGFVKLARSAGID